MKKILGFCLVMCLCSATLFAGESNQSDRRKVNRLSRCEKLIKELQLDEKQTVEFRKIHKEYAEKIRDERNDFKNARRERSKEDRKEAREEIREMRNKKDAEVKKILTDEQYKLYRERMDKEIKRNRRSR